MSTSDFKASFMLEKSILPQFVSYLEIQGKKQEITSKYQLTKVLIGEAQILVYQSGVIIFKDDPRVFSIISSFLDDHGIKNPDFERYEAVEIEEKEGQGWDETPKGVWLNEIQINALITTLNKDLSLTPGEKYERGRFVRDKQILVINNNGVVYTIGGFEGIIELLETIIIENNPYGRYERIVVIDELGRWEKVGPVGIIIADIMAHDLLQLQLRGIKDASKGRNTNFEEFIPVIEEFCSYQSLLLTPGEINQHCTNRNDYRQLLDQRISAFIEGQLFNFNDDTLLIVDKSLSPYLNHNHTEIAERNQREIAALGVTSTIGHALIDKWRQDWYLKTTIHLDRNNLDTIRLHPRKSELAKLLLL